MPPLGYTYAATRTITVGGAVAYQPGDYVHEDAVTGPDAWLRLGDDVAPIPDVKLNVPARSASQAAWAAFAVSRGMLAENAEASSRGDLIKAFAPELLADGGEDASAAAAADGP